MTTLYETINGFLNDLLPADIAPHFSDFNMYITYYLVLLLVFAVIMMPLFKIVRRLFK